MIDRLESLDKELFLILNDLHTSWLDPIMFFLSGKWEWVPLYAVMLWFLYKQKGNRIIWYLIAITLMITLSDMISSQVFKPWIARYRPCKDPGISHLVYNPGSCASPWGFVSSHAANVFAVATFFHLIFRNKWTLVLFGWAALVSYSRIYLGVHYFGDIFFGALLGALIGWFMFWSVEKFESYRFKKA